MELKEFVTDALRQILDGVKTAQEHAANCGGSINPGLETTREAYFRDAEGHLLPILSVEFDLAVVAEEGTNSKGGIGVVASVLKVGGEKEAKKMSQSTTRIKFSVPIVLPRQPDKL